MANSMEMAGGVPSAMPQNNPSGAIGSTNGSQGIQSIIPALKEALVASMDENGFVDLNKLVQVWPQIAEKFGLQITIQQLLEMVQQDPDAIDAIIQELGIAGIIKDGKQVTGEELQGQAGGGAQSMAGGGTMPPQGAV